jgi:hypothetical protein
MNRVPYNKLKTGHQQGGSEPSATPDIRLHPQFQYFKAFYENQVKEIRKNAGVPESNLPTAQFIPPKPIVKMTPKYQPSQGRGSQMPSQGSQMPSRGSQMPSQGSQMPSRGSQMPSQGSQMPSQGSQMPSQGSKNIMFGIPGIFSQGPQIPQSPQISQGPQIPQSPQISQSPQSPQMLAQGLIQMMKSKTGGGPLEDIQRRGEVKRNPPLAVEDAYLLQQYARPSIRPDMKFHGMVQPKQFTPRPFYKSDIPQLNPYALINDEGSGYELGKLYAYDRNSF